MYAFYLINTTYKMIKIHTLKFTIYYKGKKQIIDSFCFKGKRHENTHDVWLLITPRTTERASNIWSQKETMVVVTDMTVELQTVIWHI